MKEEAERIRGMKENGSFLYPLTIFSFTGPRSLLFFLTPPPHHPLLFFSLLIRPLDCSKLLSASPCEGGVGGWGGLESVLIKI